jgi:Putative auto-transporter adhesin, head GIN domain
LLIGFLFSIRLFPSDRTTKNYDIQNFKKIEISDGMILKLNQSSTYSIEVNAEKEDFEYLKLEKKGTTLEIYIDKNNYRKRGDINISISLPELTKLDLSSGSVADISMKIDDAFEGELSGGSELSGNLTCSNITFNLSGGSTTDIKGTAKNFNADGSGGSIFHLKDFSVKNVNADFSGGSHLDITMNGILNADASGGSRIVYYGNAVISNTDFSGGSGISKGD